LHLLTTLNSVIGGSGITFEGPERRTSRDDDPLSAFTFSLDQPQWALLTVFVVAQPQNGLVLANSFYRIIGNLVGATVPSGGLPR
jgi:hypothetical protein